MFQSIAKLILSSIGVLVLVACATSPTGRKQLMLISEDSAIAASAEAYQTTVGQLRREDKLANDPAIDGRVKEITGRLIHEAIAMRPDTAHWDWSLVVIDEPETVNAWSMAGGRMAIYTGLLHKVDPTDDELAQVMGHEIAHALANHAAEKMSVQLATAVGVAAVDAATGASDTVLSGAALAATVALQMPNSRAAETEADRIGIELAAKAGYDPHAASSLWRKMDAAGGPRPPEWISTHPDPANREQRLAALASQVEKFYDPRAPHPAYPL